MTAVRRNCWCAATTATACAPLVTRRGEAWPRVRCDGCGVQALWPAPHAAQLDVAYDAAYYGPTPAKFVGPLARLVAWCQAGRARLAARGLPAGSRVLDIGCGNGGFLAAMAARGHRVVGLERDARSAERGRAGGDFAVHAGDLSALPPGTFDLVTLWHVLEHLPAPDATLAEVHRRLRPGGRLLVSLPNVDSWQARWAGPHWFHHDPPRHLFGFGRRSLAVLLQASGFAIVRSSTWSAEQNVFGIVQSVLNRTGFPRDRAYEALKGLAATPSQRWLDLAMVGLLTPGAVAGALLEALCGRGGTQTVVALRN